MIVISQQDLNIILTAAVSSYPSESCGLLAGINLSRLDKQITRVIQSDNVTRSNKRESFEINPKVHFELIRSLKGTNEKIIGHYHSHPNQSAEPSKTDISMIYDPELIWLITSVNSFRETDTRAYIPSPDASNFSLETIQIYEDETP